MKQIRLYGNIIITNNENNMTEHISEQIIISSNNIITAKYGGSVFIL